MGEEKEQKELEKVSRAGVSMGAEVEGRWLAHSDKLCTEEMAFYKPTC